MTPFKFAVVNPVQSEKAYLPIVPDGTVTSVKPGRPANAASPMLCKFVALLRSSTPMLLAP